MSDNLVIGITFGSFDLLHAGHVSMLEQCKKQCNWLIVGLQTDPTINRPNIKNKPLQSTFERYTQLSALSCVDEVIPYDTEEDLYNMLSILNVNKRFIGSDYKGIVLNGEDVCKLRGIEIVFIDRLHNYSSKGLRKRVLRPLYDNPYYAYLFYLGAFAKTADQNGMFLEFGVYNGQSLTVIAENTKNVVYGFDSFKGLPEAWQGDFVKGSLACNIPTNLPKNTELVIGYFEDTLEDFLKTHKTPISFIHIDCDLYSSTKHVLDLCYDRLANECIICFDDFINYEGYEEHEFKAWMEFLEKTNIEIQHLGSYGSHQVAFKMFKNGRSEEDLAKDPKYATAPIDDLLNYGKTKKDTK